MARPRTPQQPPGEEPKPDPAAQPPKDAAAPVEDGQRDDGLQLPEDDPEGDTVDPGSPIRPAMTLQEIEDAGVAVDVPFETASARPQRLRYGGSFAEEPFEMPADWPPGSAVPPAATSS